jgi:hypothetical protein
MKAQDSRTVPRLERVNTDAHGKRQDWSWPQSIEPEEILASNLSTRTSGTNKRQAHLSKSVRNVVHSRFSLGRPWDCQGAEQDQCYFAGQLRVIHEQTR